MVKNGLVTAIFMLLLSQNIVAQDAKTVISNASKAMGAENLKTIEYSGAGAEYVFGQSASPSSPWPAWEEKSYKRTINYETPAWRVDRVLADPNPTRRGGGLALGPTQTVIVNANTPWANQVDLWMTPSGFLRAAAMNNATVKPQKIKGKNYQVLTFKGQNKASVNGYINEQNLVERVETWIDNPMLGDTLWEVVYADYKDYGGLKFPGKIVQKQGGSAILDVTITSVKPNAPADFQAPQRGGGRGGAAAGAGGGPGGGGGDAPPTSQKLADGVYLIGPFLPTYAALAVEFKDYIVVIEAPQSEARATAIMTEAKKVIPNKPVKYVVSTHAHFDHASGVRAFMAEGVTVIAHQTFKSYYEKIATMPHTLNPDKESQAKKKPAIETMGDKKILTDGNRVIELHRLQGSYHSDGLIIAYLPKEKILVEADGFNPPAQADAAPPNPPNPNQVNLLENIDRLKLDVETIIPVHYPADGRKVTKADLVRFVGKKGE